MLVNVQSCFIYKQPFDPFQPFLWWSWTIVMKAIFRLECSLCGSEPLSSCALRILAGPFSLDLECGSRPYQGTQQQTLNATFLYCLEQYSHAPHRRLTPVISHSCTLSAARDVCITQASTTFLHVSCFYIQFTSSCVAFAATAILPSSQLGD